MNVDVNPVQEIQYNFPNGNDSSSSEELSDEFNIPYTVCEIIVAVLAVVGNAMVICVFRRERRLRRRTNYYIISLALADLFVGCFGIPFAILASIGLPTALYPCLFSLSLLVVLCTISIFCLVAVSVDRYWAILHPMAYSRNVRTKTAIGIIAMCWVAGGIVGFLPLLGINKGWDSAGGKCYFVKIMSYDYLVFLYVATIILPALLLLGFYTHIYLVIIRQLRQIVTMNSADGLTMHRIKRPKMNFDCTKFRSNSKQNQNSGTMLRVLGAAQKREVKATQNLSIIVLFFMICWIPLYTINCIKAFCPDCEIDLRLTFSCIVLSHFNSAINPFLYAYHLRDFRVALKNLILRMFGRKVPSTQELNGRASVQSHHQVRLASMMDKRNSLQPRIYIDSPVWLRSQQQDPSKLNGDNTGPPSTISESLNVVHNTVAAIARSTSETRNHMWNVIIEVPSIDEKSDYQDIHTTLIDASKYDPQRKDSLVELDCHFTTDLPFHDVFDDDDNASQMQKSISNASQITNNKSENDLTSIPSIDNIHINESIENEPNIFLIENDITYLTPSQKNPKPTIKPVRNESINCNASYNNNKLGKTIHPKKTRKAYSLRNSLSSENIHKPSQIKVVRGFIYPTSNISNNGGYSNNILSSNIFNGANTLKRTLSDS